MDEEIKNQNPQTSLPEQDRQTLKDEGIEIMGEENSVNTPDVLPIPVIKTPEIKPQAKIMGPEKNQSLMGNMIHGNSAAKTDDDIRALRTYKGDVEEAIEHNRLSAVKIVTAESQRRDTKPIEQDEPKHRGTLFAAIGIIILAVVVGVGGYIFLKNNSVPPTAAQTTPKSLVEVTGTQEISIGAGENAISDFESSIEKLKITIGTLSQVLVSDKDGNLIATSSDFFTDLGVQVPQQLLIALNGQFSFGAYSSETNHPFIILGINSFDNAFPAMLAWEKTLPNDLKFMILSDHPDFVPGDTVPVFTDKIILNKDVREFDNASGTAEILYSFTDTHTLVIATTERTMSVIITELNTADVVR